jgi:hypothetical protein
VATVSPRPRSVHSAPANPIILKFPGNESAPAQVVVVAEPKPVVDASTDVFWIKLNGRVHRLCYWTAQDWEQIPESQRPGLVMLSEGKSRIQLSPVEG